MMQIKNRYTSTVLLEAETLVGANLSDAKLSSADLSRANLSYADLSGANLSYADLSGANLSGANLSGANLSGADLSGVYIIKNDKKIEINSTIKLEFQFNKHLAVYFAGFIRIGCEYHSIKYWLSNFRKIGTKADCSKSEINAYGRWLKSIKAIVGKT